jgi:rubredoxin
MNNANPPDPQQWFCRICGYIYDPRLHEGVRFEDLPPTWRCPGCGFGKNVFVRVRQVSN